MKNMNFCRQLMLVVSFGLVALLSACATPVNVDPTGTKVVTSYAAGPGMDGTTTTRSDLYEATPPFNEEERKKVMADPKFLQVQLTSGRLQIDLKRYASHGSQPLGQQLIAAGFNAVTANLLSYAVQARLQRNQQAFCSRNQCGTQFINHNNLAAVAESNQSQGSTSNTTVGVPACVAAGNCGQ